MVVADKVTCLFDVSAPLLNRLIERQPRRTLRAVDGVSFEVKRGTTVSLVGESGCGKSTMARLLVGLHRPTSGEIRFPGEGGRPRVQMIFQDPYASLNPRWRVRDIIAEPIRTLNLRSGEDATRDRVDELLVLVGLSPRDGEKYPHEFSGGQRQRISIARALATEAEFLVCDEPTSALDVSVQAQILNLMRKLQQELGLTYVFISHNLSVVRHMSDRVAVMYLGRIVEEGEANAIFANPQHPYTKLLIDTIPNLEDPNRDRKPLGGEVPSPINPPPGCAFNPRCGLATDRCWKERPELMRQSDGQNVACFVADTRIPFEETVLVSEEV
ncbi:ATP-binding cassette domain-containing protein [Microvirga sp. c23x22]|uniref:ATP-binding cassette domain-containing protein n=2 Tax=Microvirga terricola TaxID=2719797 RepID=A0ABX0VHX6_9HYPH|nr:ATP-binding cassette domain-containing protein [Microvirga terricola]